MPNQIFQYQQQLKQKQQQQQDSQSQQPNLCNNNNNHHNNLSHTINEITMSSNTQSVFPRVNSIYDAQPPILAPNHYHLQQHQQILQQTTPMDQINPIDYHHPISYSRAPTAVLLDSFNESADDDELISSQDKILATNGSSDNNKRKKTRTVFTMTQIMKLNHEFERCSYLTSYDRIRVSKELNLSESQVKVWFQNKRNKNKRSRDFTNTIQAAMSKTFAYLSQPLSSVMNSQFSAGFLGTSNQQDHHQSTPSIANYHNQTLPTTAVASGVSNNDQMTMSAALAAAAAAAAQIRNPYSNFLASWPPAGSQEARETIERYQLLYQSAAAFNSNENISTDDGATISGLVANDNGMFNDIRDFNGGTTTFEGSQQN